MSHPYGKKAEVMINETSAKVMERGGTPVTALHFKGRPYKIAERVFNFLIERRYCMPGDVLLWVINYKRGKKELEEGNGKMTIKIEIEGEPDGSGKVQGL